MRTGGIHSFYPRLLVMSLKKSLHVSSAVLTQVEPISGTSHAASPLPRIYNLSGLSGPAAVLSDAQTKRFRNTVLGMSALNALARPSPSRHPQLSQALFFSINASQGVNAPCSLQFSSPRAARIAPLHFRQLFPASSRPIGAFAGRGRPRAAQTAL